MGDRFCGECGRRHTSAERRRRYRERGLSRWEILRRGPSWCPWCLGDL